MNDTDPHEDYPAPFDQIEAREQAFDQMMRQKTIRRGDDLVREMQEGGPLVDYAAELRTLAVEALAALGTLDFYKDGALQVAQDLQRQISDYYRVCEYVDQAIEASDKEEEDTSVVS